MECPRCGKNDIRKAGKKLTIKGKAQQYQCKGCGHTFQNKKVG